MNTLPDTHVREASHCQSPVTIWQTLLTRLLDQHYGLTLNDTPFADERVIEQHIEAGISLCDAVNFLVEKYALVRTDHTRFCGLNAWGCPERSAVWLSHSSGVMASVSFIWMPVLNVCRIYPLSTGNQDKRHRMKSLTTETALDILIVWLQDNIDCESGIIFDNDEDKTDSAALLPCIEQAREGIRTLRQLQLLHQNR